MKTWSNLCALLCLLTLGACASKVIVRPSEKFLDPEFKASESETEGEDTHSSGQWTIHKTQMDRAWDEYGIGNQKVKVALLGTGVAYTHEDLVDNIRVNIGELNGREGHDDDNNGLVDDIVGWDAVENDGLAFDRVGHGTAQAGIIGAKHNNGLGIKGVNSKVSIIPVRYINEKNKGSYHTLVESLHYIKSQDVDVIHFHALSMGLPRGISGREMGATRDQLEAYLQDFEDKHIPIVMNAGSKAKEFSSLDEQNLLSVFSKFSNVIVVTSVDRDDKRPIIRNYGYRKVLTAAPGERVLTTVPGNQYREVSGSHISSAHVAGMIALLKSTRTGLTVQDIMDALIHEEGGDPVDNLQYVIRGGNRINAHKFLGRF